MVLDPAVRSTAQQLVEHPFFTYDSFNAQIVDEMAGKLRKARFHVTVGLVSSHQIVRCRWTHRHLAHPS